MIERQFVLEKKRQFEIQSYLFETLSRAGLSKVEIKRTPLGERIIIYTTRPGLVVGRAGGNIKKLTTDLKQRFHLENPQIEIAEVSDASIDPKLVAEKIVLSLERYGSKRFKAILHKALEDVMKSGALGVEIVLSGKVPSSRAKSWRVSAGYLRKCGDIAIEGIKTAQRQARLKSGVVGVKVSITPKDLDLIDKIDVEKAKVQKEDNTSDSSNKAVDNDKKVEETKKVEKKTEKQEKKEKPAKTTKRHKTASKSKRVSKK